ncbi:hypothetical protein BC628DRAFT_1502586 [Trametes gibbosa]|nr:hypothetical protein BC628DRAFT_1502586 [Trametes gibbosa]
MDTNISPSQHASAIVEGSNFIQRGVLPNPSEGDSISSGSQVVQYSLTRTQPATQQHVPPHSQLIQEGRDTSLEIREDILTDDEVTVVPDGSDSERGNISGSDEDEGLFTSGDESIAVSSDEEEELCLDDSGLSPSEKWSCRDPPLPASRRKAGPFLEPATPAEYPPLPADAEESNHYYILAWPENARAWVRIAAFFKIRLAKVSSCTMGIPMIRHLWVEFLEYTHFWFLGKYTVPDAYWHGDQSRPRLIPRNAEKAQYNFLVELYGEEPVWYRDVYEKGDWKMMSFRFSREFCFCHHCPGGITRWDEDDTPSEDELSSDEGM